MLEAYDTQCDVAARIFTQYHKRLCSFVNQVKNAQNLEADSSMDIDKGMETTGRESNIRKVCELLAVQMIEKIQNSFPAYEGSGIHLNPQLEATNIGIDFDGVIPDEVRDVILNCLKCPSRLLLAVTAYTQRLKSFVAKEIEKFDVRDDAETLRYKYENKRIMDVSPKSGQSDFRYLSLCEHIFHCFFIKYLQKKNAYKTKITKFVDGNRVMMFK